MPYIDTFVAAVPKANRAAYRKHAKLAAVVFKDCGATRIVENWGDDVPPGKLTSLPKAVRCKDDEVVVFSWIEWPNKRTRNSGMKKAMADPRFQDMSMPFDGRRMIFGGFQMLFEE